MAIAEFHKIPGSLPATLKPSTLYAIRAGVGFDLYISDSTGAIAHKVNVKLPGGAINSVQYNTNNQDFGGATSIFVEGGDLAIPAVATPAVSADKLKAIATLVAGRRMLAGLDSDGHLTVLGAHHSASILSRCTPIPKTNTSGVFNLDGIFNTPLMAGYSTYSRAIATTSVLTRLPRIAYQSNGATTSFAEQYFPDAGVTIGNGLGLGGFSYSTVFAINDGTLNTAATMFVGMMTATGVTNTANPAAITNCIGVGCDTTLTNLRLYYGGSTAQTPISLGAAFPSRTKGTDVYKLVIQASPRSNTVGVEVTRLNTGDKFSQVLTAATAGVQLPANATVLRPHSWRCTNTASSAVTLEVGPVSMETFI